MRRAWRLLDENRKGHIDMEDVKHQGVSPLDVGVFVGVCTHFRDEKNG